MPIPLDHRVADVRVSLSDGLERRGTGFLVSPGRILTALHVVTGESALSKPTIERVAGTIEVRLIGDLIGESGTAHVDPIRAARRLSETSNKSWIPVELVWPAIGEPVPRFEVALLEFADISSAAKFGSAVPPLVGDIANAAPVRALGFRVGAR
jgi:hypothetical protein